VSPSKVDCTLIRIENLTKIYEFKKKKVKALDRLNLDIRKGEIFGLLGPNGAGKTTTIKILSTLLHPTEGRVYIKGLNIIKDSRKIRTIIGVIFSSQMIYHRLTSRANLEFFGDIYAVPNLQERIEELAEFFEMTGWLDFPVEGYSKGMKLKLALMRGLIHDPEILFLDEPILGLDPTMALRLRSKIRELKIKGKTIILTTHYMIEAENLCDRIAIINKGKLVAIDTPRGLRRKIPGRNVLEVEFGKVQDINKLKKEMILAADHSVALIPVKSSDHLNLILKKILGLDLRVKSIRLIEPSLEQVFEYYTK
jgi:ABC-2 type transport system ATP-binding protein